MPSARTARPTLRSTTRLRAVLLGGSAICGVALAGWGGEAGASNLPTQGAVDLAVAASGSLNVKTLVGGAATPGAVGFVSTGVTATVSLTAPRTLIDWTTFHVAARNTLNFTFGASAGDIVINRVAGGQVNVDAGGAVNGSFAGVPGGNIWFLAPNGVFLNGTVTASGILSSNNAALADLNLLSDDVVTLKGELSAAGTLIDLSGVETTATGVVLDAAGNIVLNDNIDTGAAGVVNLASQGTITQTNGAITAASISGSSVGGASLTGPNLFDTLGGFTNTGIGAVSINDAQPTGLTVSGAVNAGFANNLTLSASAGSLSIAAPQIFDAGASGASLNLIATSALNILQPVAVDGAGSVHLSYDASSPTNLSFQNGRNASSGGSLFFNTATGSPASSSQGGSLSIDGQSYTLLYNLALTGSTGPDTGIDDIAGIDANSAAGGDAGFYALATQVFGLGSPTSPQFGVSLVGGFGGSFTGVFEGLGNAVVNLTISNTAVGQNVGLFAINSGVVRDLSVAGSSVGGGPGSIVSALVATNEGLVVQSDVGSSDISDGFSNSVLGGLVGINTTAGAIIRGQADGSVTGGVEAGGLVGENDGAISGNSTANVRVTGDVNGVDLGGLAGSNTGTISQSAAAGEVTGAVNSGNLVFIGGLVGSNAGAGTISQALSAAAVNGGPGVAYAGGLVGYDAAAVTQSGALGPVTAPGGGAIGGLIGYKDSAATVSEVYAAGAVTSGASNIGLGPLSGFDSATQGNGSPIAFGYYDTLTTGLTSGVGTGLTTTQLQGVLPAGFNNQGAAWTTGPGLYPYITAIFPGGAQGVSGVVYGDAGQTPLSSGVNGAIPVHITIDGGGTYVPSIGANGYYFVFIDSGRLNVATGSTVLTWTTASAATGSTDAAAVVALATGTTAGLDIYANSVLLPTTATTLSALEAGNPLGVTEFPTTPAFVSTQPIFVRAAGSGFDVDVAVNMSQGMTLQTTTPGAAITVNAPIALAPGLVLGLQSAGDLTLSDNLTADTVSLLAGGTIGQFAGVITAGAISGFGVNGVSLTGANVFSDLGPFTSVGGDISITDASAQGLTVSGLVSAAPGGNLTLNETGGPLALNAPLLQVAGQLTLSAAGSLGINAAITVEGAGSVVLSSNPPVSTNATFDNGGVLTGGGPLTYADAAGLPATSSQGGALTINGQSLAIIYSGGGGASPMPTQGSVDLAVATSEGSLGVTTLQNGAPTPGAVSYSSTGSAATVNLQASRTLIDWTTFAVGAGNTLNFNFSQSADDIVINRIASGAMTVDVGGSVNGLFQGAPGGAIWFLAPGGVFLNGTVTAAGILAGNNLGLPDLNLLSDPVPTLKGELAAGATLIDLTGAVTANGVAIDASQNIILSGTIDTGPAGAVSLIAQGTVTQTGGSIQTGTLSGSSIGGANLTGFNLFDTLGGFTNSALGDVVIFDNQATGLTVAGAVDAGVGANLLLASGSGGLTLAANVSAGNTVSLSAGGAIDQTAGIITTPTLTVISNGAATLTDQNLVGALGGFTNGGAGTLAFTDAIPTGLTITGDLNAGAGDIDLATTAAGAPLTLAANLITGGANTVDLISAGPITQSTGAITTGTLTGSSVGGAVVTLATNSFDNLGAFTNSGVGNVSIIDSNADGNGLTVTGAVDAGAGNTLTLSSFSPMGVATNLVLSANITAAGGTVNLNTAGGITQTAGIITTGTLIMSVSGGASLPDPNLVGALGGFTNTGTSPLMFVDAIAAGLMVSGDLNAGAGDIDLTTTGGPLTLAANLVTSGANTVDLVSAGPINQTMSIITTGSLTGSSVGGGSFSGANFFDALAGFSNIGVGAVSITDARTSGLTVTGAVDAGAGNTLTLTTTNGGPLTLAANLTAAGGTVNLISAGSISQTAGIITTATLTGASVGGATLTDANLIGDLAGFTNSGAGAVSITDTVSLAVSGPVDNAVGGPGPARDIGITAPSLTGSGVFTAGRDIALQATTGSITLASATAGDDVVLRAATTLTVSGSLNATDTASPTDNADTTAAGDVLAAADPLMAFGRSYAILTDGSHVDVVAGAGVTVDSARASGDVRMQSLTGNVLTLDVTAGRDVVIDAAGSFGPNGSSGADPIAAGRDVAIRSTAGSLDAASISAGDDVVLIAPTGAVDLNGAVTASGSAGQGAGQTLFSTVSAPLAGLFILGNQSIFIGADTYVNTVSPASGAPSVLTATNGVGIALTDARGLDVADADPKAGSWVQPATLSTPTVSLFETGGPLTIHDTTVGGPITALNLYAPGQVLVTGVLAPAVDNTVSLAIGAPDTPTGRSVWSPSQIEVVNDGLTAANHGAIGAETVNGGAYSATPRTFYAASLYAANDILLGTQAFISANAAITSSAQLQQIDPNQPFPATAANTSDAVLLAAGDLSLSAGRMIVQQDTAGLTTTNGIGTYVTRTLSLDSVGPNPPPAIDLFGAFVSSGQTTPIAGTAAAFSSQLRLSQRLSLSGYRQLYRLNTATISPGSSPLVTVTTIPADPTTQGAALIPDAISIDSGDAISQLGGFDVVSRSSSRPSVAFSWLFADGFVRYQDTDVEDLTATGAPNEEIWRTPD